MNNRPIKILTLCGLLAILALQGIWLFTTYSTVRNETIKKSNELFKTAVTTELHIRMDNYTDEDGNDVSIEKNFHMDLSDNIDYSDYAVNCLYRKQWILFFMCLWHWINWILSTRSSWNKPIFTHRQPATWSTPQVLF